MNKPDPSPGTFYWFDPANPDLSDEQRLLGQLALGMREDLEAAAGQVPMRLLVSASINACCNIAVAAGVGAPFAKDLRLVADAIEAGGFKPVTHKGGNA